MSNKNDYAKLRKEWYEKLANTGFTDSEDLYGNLKAWSSRFATKRRTQVYSEKQPYYYMATQFINDYQFANRIEQIIWEYHAEGLSARDITKLLVQGKIKKTNRQTVWLTVKKLEKSMLKMYMSNSETNNE